MLHASIIFLTAGLIALSLGFYGSVGITFEVGRFLLFGFLTVSILTFLVSLWSNRRRLN
jgi:uncharacterized membrane protein YtjA (UPF0391 family)